MTMSVRRALRLTLAGALLVIGGLLVLAAWDAWDPLPPDGPAWSDQDRTTELAIGAIGVALVAAAARSGLRAVRRVPSSGRNGGADRR